jgi:hypothetical protein
MHKTTIDCGAIMNEQIEYVARAFYDAECDAQVWDREPEILKEEFRQYAREALALLAQHQDEELSDTRTIELHYAA